MKAKISKNFPKKNFEKKNFWKFFWLKFEPKNFQNFFWIFFWIFFWNFCFHKNFKILLESYESHLSNPHNHNVQKQNVTNIQTFEKFPRKRIFVEKSCKKKASFKVFILYNYEPLNSFFSGLKEVSYSFSNNKKLGGFIAFFETAIFTPIFVVLHSAQMS